MAFILRAPAGATKKRKIVGRGSGSGTGGTSGRGHKGQNARSGGGVRPGFEGGQMPLYRRIARRGFSNSPFKTEFIAVNIDVLDKNFDDGGTVSLDSLVEKGIIRKSETSVKILGRGEISKKLTVEGIAVSAGAKQKIEKAGGTVRITEENQQEEAHG